ncbi:MAG: NAD(P)/FAD-dependent oxidoreductase [Pyrinomonadaceae bacterium]
MAKILILGGGFGGLIAAEQLSKVTSSEDQITLVSPSRKFTFYPALVQLAFGECKPDDIAFDLVEKLDYLDVRYIEGEMLRINAGVRTVEVAGPEFRGDIAYDYLVIAVGRRLATEKVPGFFEYANHLLGVRAALKFGERVRDFRSGTIVVGECPGARLPVPACETAFALARRFENEVRDGSVQIKAVFPDSLSAAFGGADLHKQLEPAFRSHGINVHYEVPIREITASSIVSSEKHEIGYDLLMLVPPFRGDGRLRRLGITDESDYVLADRSMRVKGFEKAYAVGDIVAFSGPKFGHMAVRQAEIASSNIAAELQGKGAHEEYYHEIATIIDAGGPDSIYLRYGIWDDAVHRLKKGTFWGWLKSVHPSIWQARHK